jgi:hypothetical protein
MQRVVEHQFGGIKTDAVFALVASVLCLIPQKQ